MLNKKSGRFTEQPLSIRRDLNNKSNWILNEKVIFIFTNAKTDNTFAITVPEEFSTDFASTPKILWGLFPPMDADYAKSAAIHDWLYYRQEVTRRFADELFLIALKSQGVRFFKRQLMHRAVRMFGKKPWQAHTKRKEEQCR
ncbi:MAG: phage tail protein [Chloroflexi bacterium]|nr:MAG: phage tail protein [Chloroflexota bacterium]